MSNIIRNANKAALSLRAKLDGKTAGTIRVNFDGPNGTNGNKVRFCTPVVLPNGKVVVRAFRGIWTVKATLVRHSDWQTGELLKNAAGQAYRSHIRFDAQHVAWSDEYVLNTPNQIQDAVNRRDWQAREVAVS